MAEEPTKSHPTNHTHLIPSNIPNLYHISWLIGKLMQITLCLKMNYSKNFIPQ
jgi:hypothetical protein